MSNLFEININDLTTFDNQISSNLIFFEGNSDHFIQHTPMMYLKLSPTEQERADKFIFPNDRDNYIISHYMLNKQLAKELKTPSDSLNINSKNWTKPYIPNTDIDFNLSHSNNLFCFAITKTGQIGVDIEKINNIKYMYSIVNNYMHINEINYIYDNFISNKDQISRFFEIWTRKEAFLKMLGIGISTELSQINMTPNNRTISINDLRGIKISYKKVFINTWTNNDFIISICSNVHDLPQWSEINSL